MNSTKYADNWIFANSLTVEGNRVPTYLNLAFQNPLANAGMSMLKREQPLS